MNNIRAIIKNDVIRKILLFFNENPHSIDTAKGISIWIGCNIHAVQMSLNRLVKEGVLVNHKTASTDAYSYTNDRDIIRKVERYILGKSKIKS